MGAERRRRGDRNNGAPSLTAQSVNLKGLIFDIDGTLVDTNDLHARCWIEAFAHFGKHFEYDVIRHQIGKGGDRQARAGVVIASG